MDINLAIMGIAGMVILSYFFNMISKKWNIPTVLMLITVGVIIHLSWGDVREAQHVIFPILQILGTVGIIMIVLEASLDLKLESDKRGLIARSFFAALGILLVTVFLVASVLTFLLDLSPAVALVHAIPLSIMSSAIVIPSIGHLKQKKREFMIYEATFSDILGIMLFYFVLDGFHKSGGLHIAGSILLNIAITLISAIVLGFAMIIVFQRIKETVGLFFLICVLIFLYAFGKMFHLSSLLIVFFFGLLVNNQTLFFQKKLARFINKENFELMYGQFKLVIEETSFIIRTFFFVVFGMSISLHSVLNIQVLMISGILTGIMYAVRFVNLKIVKQGRSVFPELFIAPRGLITVLLFYAIPEDILSEKFDPGILLMVILVTSFIMMIGLLGKRKGRTTAESTSPEGELSPDATTSGAENLDSREAISGTLETTESEEK